MNRFTASRLRTVAGSWILAFALAPVAASAQAPTGYASLLVDRLPNRDTTEFRARLFAQEKLDLSDKVRVLASGFAEGLVADRNGATSDAIAEPQDLQIELHGKRMSLLAGNARIVWGRLDELQPTDVVNPIDISRFFFEGRSEARMALPLLQAKFFAGEKATLEGVYVPWFRRGRFDRLDEPTSPFNVSPKIPFVDEVPARNATNGQGGARLNVTSGRVDWSVSAYRGFRPFGLYSAAGPVELSRIYPRFTMLGADFETVSGAWGMRGEAAVFVRDAFQSADTPLVRTGQSLDLGGAVDRKAGDYRVSGQVLVHRESYDEITGTALPASRTDVSLIVSTDRSFARQRYESRVFGVYNPNSGAGFLRGILTANLRDNVALEGSLGWFGGSGADAISRFSDSDFAYVRLKYFF
jgi:hypothetical protein